MAKHVKKTYEFNEDLSGKMGVGSFLIGLHISRHQVLSYSVFVQQLRMSYGYFPAASFCQLDDKVFLITFFILNGA